ncbi:MAG: hypothetical protein FJX72_00645 [Armatimonadetes bacterium]|nr:hypothetical protein [Armatimonadota bacterium]
MGDDAAGPRVGRALMRRPIPGACVLVCHQLTPEIAESLSRATHALFVDARVPDGDTHVRIALTTPNAGCRRDAGATRDGSVKSAPACLEDQGKEGGSGEGLLLGHQMPPSDLLALTIAVYGRAPESWTLTLPTEHIGLSESLSPVARSGIRSGSAAARRLAASLGYGAIQ